MLLGVARPLDQRRADPERALRLVRREDVAVVVAAAGVEVNAVVVARIGARPSITIPSQSLQPFWPQPTSSMDGSVRFMTMANSRAFLT